MIAKVLYNLPDINMTIIDCGHQQAIIDNKSVIDFVPTPGQELLVELDDSNYVTAATLNRNIKRIK